MLSFYAAVGSGVGDRRRGALPRRRATDSVVGVAAPALSSTDLPAIPREVTWNPGCSSITSCLCHGVPLREGPHHSVLTQCSLKGSSWPSGQLGNNSAVHGPPTGHKEIAQRREPPPRSVDAGTYSLGHERSQPITQQGEVPLLDKPGHSKTPRQFIGTGRSKGNSSSCSPTWSANIVIRAAHDNRGAGFQAYSAL